MSFKSVEKSLAELRSIQDYDRVLDEKRKLENQVNEIEEIYEDRLENLYSLIASKDAELTGLRELRIKYKRNQYSLKQFDALVNKRFNEKVTEKVDDGVRKRWELESPTLIEAALKKEVQRYPTQCSDFVYRTVEAEALKRRDELLKQPELWPGWLRQKISMEAERTAQERLDEVFNQRVEQQAQERLQKLVHVEWPRFMDTRILPLCRGTLLTLIRRMNTTMEIRCPRCGSVITVAITPFEAARLVTHSRIHCNCLNPECRGFLGPTKIWITLGDVFYILSQRPIPMRVVVAKSE